MYIYMQAEFYIFPQTESSTIPERKISKKKLIRFHRTKVNLISLFFYNLMSQLIDLTPT